MVSDDGESGTPSRRTTRKRTQVNYNENVVKIEESKEPQTKKRRARKPRQPAKRPRRSKTASSTDKADEDAEADRPGDESNKGESGEDLDRSGNDDGSMKEPPVKKKRKAAKKEKTGRGPESDRTCPHCGKVCVSKPGLKYHIDHLVCRPDLRKLQAEAEAEEQAGEDQSVEYHSENDDDDAERPRKKRKAAKGPAKKRSSGKKRRKKSVSTDKSRNRGKVKDRTCPNCNRVFTSILGRNYHVNNKVCEGEGKKSKSDGAYPRLVPGSKYVTQYGVVEIVADNRGTPPKGQAPRKRKKEAKMNLQIWQALAAKTRIRRDRLWRFYENGQMDQTSVWKSYFGGDPRTVIAHKKRVPEAPKPPDPHEAYADRMVECVLVPDERNYQRDEDESNDDDTKSMQVSEPPASLKSQYGMKLFLRRSIIQEKYIPTTTVHVCGDCGAGFSSQAGYTYHARSEVCISKTKRRAAAARQQLEIIEKKFESALKRRDKEKSRPDRQQMSRNKKNLSVYPGVWLSLGFKFLPRSKAKRAEAVERAQEDSKPPPDDVLHRLRTELRRDRDRRLGVIYPGVYESLGFRLPPPQWVVDKKKKQEAKRQKQLEQRRMKKKEAASIKKKPPPPIVDIRVLADEADSGRYPSMKRYSGEHKDVCAICRKGGSLLCCDFCPKVVHLECIRSKHTIKDPEPQDDFMCHLCIQYIMQRRNRAEKRRLMKQRAALKKSGQDAGTDVDGDGEYESAYHAVAAEGQELSEIMELLSDAKSRLRQAIGVSKMNEARRSVLGL